MGFTHLIKYPVDTTGVHPDNRVSNELHDISPMNRVIVPRHGYFYGESLIVLKSDKTRLTLGKDYRLDDMNEELTKITGKAVMSSIILLDERILGEVAITYQCYGSNDNSFQSEIARLVKEAKERGDIHYKDIVNPPEYFRPAPHRHPVWDTYGWKATQAALQDIIQILSNWKIERDGALYAKISEYQQDTIKRIAGVDENIRALKIQLNEYDGIESRVDSEIEKLNQAIHAVADIDSIRTLIEQSKESINQEVTGQLDQSKTWINNFVREKENQLQEQIRRIESRLNPLSTDLDQRINQVNTQSQQRDVELGNRVSQLETRITGSLSDYVTKTSLTAQVNEVNNKLTKTALKEQLDSEYLPKFNCAVPNTFTNNINAYVTDHTHTKTGFYYDSRSIGTSQAFSLSSTLSNGHKMILVVNEAYPCYTEVWTSNALAKRNFLLNGTVLGTGNSRSENFDTRKDSTVGVYSLTDNIYHFGIQNSAYDAAVFAAAGNTTQGQLFLIKNKEYWVRIKSNLTNNQWIKDKLLSQSNFNDVFPLYAGLPNRLSTLEQSINNRPDRVQVAADWANFERMKNKAPMMHDNGDIWLGYKAYLMDRSCARVDPRRLDAIQDKFIQMEYYYDDTLRSTGVCLNGVVKAVNVITTSDARLKEDIKPLNQALKDVLMLSGYSYRLKDGGAVRRGVLAQEVEMVIPEAVSVGKDGYKAVDYQALTATLFEAVKALKRENDDLKERLMRLESRVL